MNNRAAAQAPTGGDSVLDRNDPRWGKLRDLIERLSLKRGEFILSSGRASNYLFQLRQTTMHPEGARLIGDIIADYMKRWSISCVGGLEMGAVPIVSSVAVMSAVKGAPVDAFFVRKQAKEHGARELIDGHVTDGGEVLIVDDVATSGGSILKAIVNMKTLYPACYVRKGLVVVDREEGAAEALAKDGVELVSIFKRKDFNIDG
jgi:orotate phosphoribosyltransferase